MRRAREGAGKTQRPARRAPAARSRGGAPAVGAPHVSALPAHWPACSSRPSLPSHPREAPPCSPCTSLRLCSNPTSYHSRGLSQLPWRPGVHGAGGSRCPKRPLPWPPGRAPLPSAGMYRGLQPGLSALPGLLQAPSAAICAALPPRPPNCPSVLTADPGAAFPPPLPADHGPHHPRLPAVSGHQGPACPGPVKGQCECRGQTRAEPGRIS